MESSTMRRIISSNSIQAAINQLEKRGKNLSIRNIRAITGGSNRLIMKLRAIILGDNNTIVKRNNNVPVNRLNSLEAKVRELEKTIEQLKKVIEQNNGNEIQDNNNVSIEYDSNDNVTTLEPSQNSNITLNNDNDTKDSNTLEAYIKLSDIKKVVTEWKTKCTPERAKAARWEKANNLLTELQRIMN